MHFVCAAAHRPPKEVQIIQKKKRYGAGRGALHKIDTPLVTSNEGRRRNRKIGLEIWKVSAIARKMEKSMI